YQVDTTMLMRDDVLPTTMAFVSLTADGERDFQFNRGADKNMNLNDIPMEKLQNAAVLHFGSATALLPGTPFQDAYFMLMDKAHEMGNLVSFDPNFRQDLWKGSTDLFIKLATQFVRRADFVKVSVEELELLTNKSDIAGGIKSLHEIGASVVAVTTGASGTVISNGKEQEHVPSKKVQAVDATGAGDAFVGAMLYQIAGKGSEALYDFSFLKKAVRFANHVGAHVCTKIGALSALPVLEEVDCRPGE